MRIWALGLTPYADPGPSFFCRARPYDEYIDEIGKTGLCRVEAFGFGLYVDGTLIFYPNYQVALVKPGGRF